MSDQKCIREMVYNLLMEDILSYEYRPNDILTEKYLVEKYGYSKTSVREALLILCEEGVLRSIPRYGYEVIRITTDDIREMLQYRYMLEVSLLQRKIDWFTEKQVIRLEEINKKCTNTDKNIWEHWKYNSEFHLKMVSYCGNSYAERMLHRTMNHLKCAYAQCYWNDLNEFSLSMDTRYHENIIQCLREKDIDTLILNIRKDLCEFGGPSLYIDLGAEESVKDFK